MYNEVEDKRVSSFPVRVNEAMERAGIKTPDLIRATGLHKSAVYRYISGEYEPKQKAISSMAIALGVSEMWLYGYDVPMARTDSQQKNDALVGLINRLRTDKAFYEVVSALDKMQDAQLDGLRSLILPPSKE